MSVAVGVIMTRFTDTTVLVTGGTGGQGASHIRALHAAGANVVIGATDRDRGAAPASDLGERALATRLDVTALVLYLASSEATFITGSEFVVDGGLLLGPALRYDAA
jgi:3alpha(or 20beta)-hydroxysteroid dehydrogenase